MGFLPFVPFVCHLFDGISGAHPERPLIDHWALEHVTKNLYLLSSVREHPSVLLPVLFLISGGILKRTQRI